MPSCPYLAFVRAHKQSHGIDLDYGLVLSYATACEKRFDRKHMTAHELKASRTFSFTPAGAGIIGVLRAEQERRRIENEKEKTEGGK